MRGLALVLLVAAFIPAIFFANESSARVGYPFLQAEPPRVPDVVYVPTYLPADIRPVSMRISMGAYGSLDLEMWNLLASGDELRIWESTRYDATVRDAVGPYREDARLSGSLATWGSGHTLDGRANLLHARIGQTLVVIVGALPPEELLRIADSLRRSTASAQMLF